MKISELREQFGKEGWTIKQISVHAIAKNVRMFQAERISGLVVKSLKLEELRDFLAIEGHTPECQAKVRAMWESMDEWARQHPNYCKACNGWGGSASSYDPSPAGVSLGSGSMWEFDPCSDCVSEGICPQCSTHMTQKDEVGPFLCPNCGWDEEEPTDGMPQQDDMCACQYAEEEAYFEAITEAQN